MFANLSKIYNEFPRKFWGVVGVSFIDRVGGTLLFPFFSLDITENFNGGMTQAGLIVGWLCAGSAQYGLDHWSDHWRVCRQAVIYGVIHHRCRGQLRGGFVVLFVH